MANDAGVQLGPLAHLRSSGVQGLACLALRPAPLCLAWLFYARPDCVPPRSTLPRALLLLPTLPHPALFCPVTLCPAPLCPGLRLVLSSPPEEGRGSAFLAAGGE